ncbi:Os12g0255200, partial [Oryza sativa Japonica Group]
IVAKSLIIQDILWILFNVSWHNSSTNRFYHHGKKCVFGSQGILAFYGFPIPTISKEASENHPSSIPKGVLFVLKTLPVRFHMIYHQY